MTGWSLEYSRASGLKGARHYMRACIGFFGERVKASGGELKAINEGNWHPFPPPPPFLFLGSQYFVITK